MEASFLRSHSNKADGGLNFEEGDRDGGEGISNWEVSANALRVFGSKWGLTIIMPVWVRDQCAGVDALPSCGTQPCAMSWNE